MNPTFTLFKCLFGCCFLVLMPTLRGQDVHFSQFDNAPLYTNGGQTGMFAGDYRFVGNYRSQWASVPVPYSSFSASADMRLLRNKLENDVLGAGLTIIQDKAGDSQLSTSSICLSLAFTKKLAQNLFIFGGANAGLGQRRFKTNALRFDDQYQGDQFNPNSPSADLGNLQNTAFRYADVGVGFGLRWQRSRRTWLNVGVSMQHLNRPAQSFMGTDAQLAARSVLYAAASFRLHYQWDFLPSLQAQAQFPHQSLTFGSIFRYHLNQSLGRETAIFMGCYYRNKDAVIPVLGLNYQTWQFGLSYDVNISNFQVATNRNGAIELSLIYILAKVPKLPTTKICPIL